MSNIKKDDLAPCPFCGSEADIKCEGKNAWSVECMNEHCGVFLPTDSWYISRENAIKAWNTRPFDNFKPCLCSKSEAKTVKRITSQIWQCPRCGGLGSISEPAVSVLSVEEIYNVISEFPESIHFIAGKKKDMAQAIHALITRKLTGSEK